MNNHIYHSIGNNSNCTFYIDDVEIREEYDMEMCWVDDYSAYRYGFNGMERDDEAKGAGNSYDFGARMYDSRLGRFLSLDPRIVDYPNFSPYCFATNTPVMAVDANGEGPIIVIQSKVRSAELKTLIYKYAAGEIKFSDLYSSVKDVMGQSFKSGFDLGWLEKKYDESKLSLRYSENHLDDRSYDRYAQPLPYVGYEQSYVENDKLYVTLIEEGEDGVWNQVQYIIEAPENTFTKEELSNTGGGSGNGYSLEQNIIIGVSKILPGPNLVHAFSTLFTGEDAVGEKQEGAYNRVVGPVVTIATSFFSVTGLLDDIVIGASKTASTTNKTIKASTVNTAVGDGLNNIPAVVETVQKSVESESE